MLAHPVPGGPALQLPPLLEQDAGVGVGVGAGVACDAVDVGPAPEGRPASLVVPPPPCVSEFWTAWSPPPPAAGVGVGAIFVPLPPPLPASGEGVAAVLLPAPAPGDPGLARAGTITAANASANATSTTRRSETARVFAIRAVSLATTLDAAQG